MERREKTNTNKAKKIKEEFKSLWELNTYGKSCTKRSFFIEIVLDKGSFFQNPRLQECHR